MVFGFSIQEAELLGKFHGMLINRKFSTIYQQLQNQKNWISSSGLNLWNSPKLITYYIQHTKAFSDFTYEWLQWWSKALYSLL